MTASPLALSPNGEDVSVSRRMTRALSESDLRDYSAVSKKKPPHAVTSGGLSKTTTTPVEEEEEETSLDRLLSSSGLDEVCEVGDRERELASVLVDGGGGGGVGGRICGGGGGGRRSGGGGRDGDSNYWDSNHGKDRTDVYYRKMIEANPSNALLLGNYAKFLKDVCTIRPFLSSQFVISCEFRWVPLTLSRQQKTIKKEKSLLS